MSFNGTVVPQKHHFLGGILIVQVQYLDPLFVVGSVSSKEVQINFFRHKLKYSFRGVHKFAKYLFRGDPNRGVQIRRYSYSRGASLSISRNAVKVWSTYRRPALRCTPNGVQLK